MPVCRGRVPGLPGGRFMLSASRPARKYGFASTFTVPLSERFYL